MRRFVVGGWWFVVLAALAVTPSQPAFAQLAPAPNPKGVVFGHLHFSTQDPAAFRNFWVAFGGASTPNLDLDLVELPGVYLVTFQRDQIAPMDTLEASGVAIDRPYRLRRPGDQRVALGYVLDPWGTAIEMTENIAPDKPGTR